MPQEFRILRCYSCEIFQVDIVKKTTKWICKLCGEKQSVKKIYGSGSAKDCRLYVQQLNQPKEENNGNFEEIVEVQINESPHPKRSKWSEFLDSPSEQPIDKDLNDIKANNIEKHDDKENIFEHTGNLDMSLEI